MEIKIKKLSPETFSDYETLTTLDQDKPCYCSWWHIKPTSMEEYDEEKRNNPEKFKNCIKSKMENGFHMGVLAYENNELLAWIAIAPLPEFYWTWKRVAQLGEKAATTAGIVCFNTAPKFRGKGRTKDILNALCEYGKNIGWEGIESYPFEQSAIEKHGDAVLWPGTTSEFREAGFERIGDHWLSSPEAERSVYYKSL